mgnify:CR=1 FL=1
MTTPESSKNAQKDNEVPTEAKQETADKGAGQPAKPNEIGGPKGLEPTRYGDWEQKGRCIDF